jgi:pimeloyl-ACP methyl ester carboxylesterase
MLVPLCAAPILATLLSTSPAHAAVVCSQVTVPVSSVGTGPPDLQVAATLCRPDWQTPRVVQLLVHGATYSRGMWDWPYQPDTYSYVKAAVSQGYATLAVDRIGHGQSTHPPSENVTISSGTTALHGVVTALRAGTVGGITFQKVLWVGHSMGAIHGYDYGGRYTDVDAYLFTGNAHFIKPSWLDLIKNSLQPSNEGPGYLTTVPGTRDDLYYRPVMADPLVISQDEATKGVLTDGEVQEAIGLTFVPPTQSPTQAITKPVFVLLGEFDNLTCGSPDGLTCTKANVLALEAPYFTHAPKLDVVTVSGAGHSMMLHTNAPASHWAMINWARTVAPPT